jgi:membrane-bound lytic murein transglycosylase B
MLNYVKILSISIVIALCFVTQGLIAQETFSEWLEGFKVQAIKKGISEQTVNDAFRNVKFLEKVIGYDRKQPEFIEKTEIYLSKRANKKSLERSIQAYKENKKILDKVETEFNV